MTILSEISAVRGPAREGVKTVRTLGGMVINETSHTGWLAIIPVRTGNGHLGLVTGRGQTAEEAAEDALTQRAST